MSNGGSRAVKLWQCDAKDVRTVDPGQAIRIEIAVGDRFCAVYDDTSDAYIGCLYLPGGQRDDSPVVIPTRLRRDIAEKACH